MNKIDSNISILQNTNWHDELARVSVSDNKRALWIMVDKNTGEIQKISKHLYDINDVITGHLDVKGSFLQRTFALSLGEDCQEEWPESITAIVNKSLQIFGELELT
jgi:hypothetical protein